MNAVARPLSPERSADFERLLELTRSLRAEVELGDWGRAAALETDRRAVVERVFDTAPSAEELPALVATLREVVRINDELIGLAEHRRRAIAREADTVALGHRASRAYRSLGVPFSRPGP